MTKYLNASIEGSILIQTTALSCFLFIPNAIDNLYHDIFGCGTSKTHLTYRCLSLASFICQQGLV